MGNMSAIPPENMLLAVPKKGRLNEKVMKLLVDGVGMEYRRPDRVDVAHCTNMPVSLPAEISLTPPFFSRRCPSNTPCLQVTLVFLPAHDIAVYVGEGNVDMGITGEDVRAALNLSSHAPTTI
jgi:ATP phosphoribosyltransferase